MRIPLVPWLSLMFCYLYWTHLGVAITVVHGQTLEDQQSLLLQLKSRLQFKQENSSKLVSWNESIDYCQWKGVTCDDKRQVSGLDLSEESIHGGFDNSSSLFSLQNLQVLNLAINNFNSVIPSAFNKLKNLSYLNLSYAGFVGQIPIEISHLTMLVTLDFSSYYSIFPRLQLKLQNPNLQKIVQNLTKIRQLYLDGVSISAQGHDWCNTLLLLPSLQEVSMSNCNLSGPLDSSLTKLKNLSVIRLDGNYLSSPVPETFASFKNLTTLSLGNCGLKGKFPEKIFQVATLLFIDISFNIYLQGSLPKFPLNGPLKTLVVSNTSLSGALPDSISKLRQLSILDLSTSQFNGTLPNSMSKLMELTYLDLSSNKFVGPIPSFNVSKNLTHLDMSHNLLNESLPASLFALPLLQSIQLSNNKFQSHLDGFSSISSTMLKTLDLSSNNLEGPIPTSIFQLRSLSVLLLASNKFSGTIHMDEFQRLENLTTLDLSHNNLTIDANVTDSGVSSIPKMRNIMLASCSLTKFPSFLRNQSKLTFLDLSSNDIQGSIPRWIWQVGSLTALNISHNLLTKLEGPVRNTSATLRVLDLHSNYLRGRLPIFPAVYYLDYSINNFSYIIPPTIGSYLSSINFLSFSKNSLSGSIPSTLCNNSNLLVLDFSHNHFNGTIPECLLQSESLLVLNLEYNKLNGNIADTFPEYCTLRSLHLNGNQLVGPIPKTLLNCTALEVLSLGNNQIYDEFPCFLKRLSTLRVLLLSKNRLHGEIGCSKINGTWQKLQIVDLAFNSFSGFLPRKDFKTWKAMMLEVHDALDFIQIQTPIPSFDHIYYQDSVTVTSKGLQMEFVKFLNFFTSIDFSSNNFQGPIPEELMNFTGLHVLNLSHNALTDQIPSSVGNLKQLESLDLSSNHFDGEIPTQLASLSFLSCLNLSYNQLVGRIPTYGQLSTFPGTSFEGNAALCGPTLMINCSNLILPPSPSDGNSDPGTLIEWNFLRIELGYICGLGIIIFPVMFWKRWRLWYWRHVDDLLFKVFPQLDFVYERRGGQNYRTLRLRP